MTSDERFTWWAALKHGGMLIAPARLAEFFPEVAPSLSSYVADRLRRAVTLVQAGDEEGTSLLLDVVLEEVLGFDKALWRKGPGVDSSWSRTAVTGEAIKPRRVWLGRDNSALSVFVSNEQRLGVGRSRRAVSRVVEWLRKTDRKIALLTNGRQWRLIHAGADYNAWCEWDIDFWFEEGRPGAQVDALRILLAPSTVESVAQDKPGTLLAAIQASRQGQTELSSILGERVRQAVELLIRASSVAIENSGVMRDVTNKELYIAANRVIMRCVILLFAESRELLPLSNSIYYGSYSVQGLREELDRRSGAAGRERLRNSFAAWPRLLGLFRLVYSGSAHQALPVQRYGGELFAPGETAATDPVSRAVQTFENLQHAPSDLTVYQILELLTRSQVKVRQGKSSAWVEAPIDFSDLSTEYIGILYQGLLDFELRQAAEPMIFLNLGDQPALPLSRLEAMDDAALETLVEKMKAKPAAHRGEADGEEETNEDEQADEDDADSDKDETDVSDVLVSSEPMDDFDDVKQALHNRAVAWAVRAVRAGNLIAKPKSSNPNIQVEYETDVADLAGSLIARTFLPGDWFLVRWGGTRKGSGTFYTRPQLGVPLVRRTLQPLCYDVVDGELIPKRPEEILALKGCDSAMGSGSLVVAMLRYLTDALFASLFHYGRIQANGDSTLCRLADGQGTNSLTEETLPVPLDHSDFEEKLRARLKRYVAERCIYGVDIDPLAVELARLAVWVETMDPSLPFEFLDHKLKCGNALVGCWFDQFQDYPVMAWEREGGDKNHTNFVNHFREHVADRGQAKGKVEQRSDVWTQTIKEMRSSAIKLQMIEWIRIQHGSRQFEFASGEYTAADIHALIREAIQKIYVLKPHQTEEKAELYKDYFGQNQNFQRLRQTFDTWCAIWFWPGDLLRTAPLPKDFQDPSPAMLAVVEQLRRQHRFFHWELEFPDVFAGENPGFHALVENPPWEILKPKSQEFFSNLDPLYRTYGKQEALARQKELFAARPDTEREWIEYNARFRALSNWNKHAAFPFGDDSEGGERFSFVRSARSTNDLHSAWRRLRAKAKSFADPKHPFRHQGPADINAYKMFLELSHALLRQQGRMGMIVPSGLYTDKGTKELRELFLDSCSWELLFSIENREKIFDIHSGFKFCLSLAEKGGITQSVATAFMRRSLLDWEDADRYIVPYPRAQVTSFSPKSKALLETRTQADLDILTKIYANSITLGDESDAGWGIKYTCEFHMTGDSKLFPPLSVWERKGYRPDEYGHWLKGDWKSFSGNPSVLSRASGLILSRDGASCIYVDDVEDIALPLYEGRMVGQFDFSQKGWVSGKGRTAVWREIPWENKVIEPQFLMGDASFRENIPSSTAKLGFLAVGSSTNARSMVCSALNSIPCGNAVPTLHPRHNILGVLILVGIMNSLTYDFAMRCRLGGINLNYFVVEETPLLDRTSITKWNPIIQIAAKLNWCSPQFASTWLSFMHVIGNSGLRQRHWFGLWAVTEAERLRMTCVSDAVAANAFGIVSEDFAWILRDCDHPIARMNDKAFYRTLDPKGFWRVGKDKDPELRHTVLAQVAFHDLQEKGIDEFLNQNNGEGWMIPETLRLADYGLGHDNRAREHQPVASRLGTRFYDWQLAGTPEESWEECERHAENLRLLLGEDDLRNENSGDRAVRELPSEYRAVQLGLDLND